MQKFKLKDKVYELPTNWADIKLKTYQKLINYMTPEATDELSDYDLISLLTGCDSKQLEFVNILDFLELTKRLDFIKQPLEPKEQNKNFEIDGKKYLLSDPNKMSIGEAMDFQNQFKGGEKDIIKNFDKIIATIIREEDPETNKIVKYDSNDTTERAKIFKEHLNAFEANEAFVFFSENLKQLHTDIKNSLKENSNKKASSETNILLLNTDGSE